MWLIATYFFPELGHAKDKRWNTNFEQALYGMHGPAFKSMEAFH